MSSSSSGAAAHRFYRSRGAVEQYERGRCDRLFVVDLPRLLTVGRHHGFAEQLPLYVLFDWLYDSRLRFLSEDVLWGHILDLGCGTSYFYRGLIADGWRGQVSGIDVSAAMIAEGSRQLERLRAWQTPSRAADRGQYRFRDALGRKTLSASPPIDLVDANSVDHLLRNRFVGDAGQLPAASYAVVTSFSGPFCFYPRSQQRSMVLQACDRATRSVSLQFKNAGFHAMNRSSAAVAAVAATVDHIAHKAIEDSHAYLCSIGFQPPALCSFDLDAGIPHEVGEFEYYTSGLDEVLSWLAEAGFIPVRIGTMGFLSQTFYDLLRPHHAAVTGDPSGLAALVRCLSGIDEYFCCDLLLGDNLHITAVRRTTADAPEVAYRPTGTYRRGYRIQRTESGN